MVWADEAVISHEPLTLILQNIHYKVLYSATRPKKMQEFIHIDRFMSTWINNRSAFENDPPEVAITYTKMPVDKDGIVHAIPIKLSNPTAKENNSWQFDLAFPKNNIAIGKYQDAALFIDWFPSSICPEPIRLLFPESANY